FNILCYMFYGYLGKFAKKIGIGLVLLFNLIYFYNLISEFDDFRSSLMTYTYVSGSIFLIVIIIMMLNEMLKVESFESITRNLLFWVSFGLFVFYATSFPIFSISNLKELLGDFQIQAAKILLVVIFLMHSILITGFLWSKKKYSY